MKHVISFFLISILFFNCENDLDINAEWKEIPVMYSVLNSGDFYENNTEHFIRIQKSFLGEAPAEEMAQISDSIYYPEGEILVWVEELINNVIIDSIGVELVAGINKPDDGYFSSENHVFYKFNNLLNQESEFRINFFNQITKKFSYGTTKIVEPIRIKRWPTNNYNTSGFLELGKSNPQPLNLEIYPSKNGKLYSFFLRFNYVEVNINTNQKDTLYIDWNFSPETATEYQVNDETNLTIDFKINPIAFFQYLGGSIPEKSDVYRYPKGVYYQGTEGVGGEQIAHPCIEFHFEILDVNLYNYLMSQSPAGLVQNRPIYTNIYEGAGLVSSTSSFSFDNLKMDNTSNDSLAYGRFTKHLNFACFDQTILTLEPVLDCP